MTDSETKQAIPSPEDRVTTQSVCKHCQQQILECTATRPDSTGQCKGYIHTATGSHFCDRGVAEPASTGEPPEEFDMHITPRSVTRAARPSEPSAQYDALLSEAVKHKGHPLDIGRLALDCYKAGEAEYGKPGPSAPQTSAERIITAPGLGVTVPLGRYNELIDAQRHVDCLKRPQESLLNTVAKYLEHGLTVSHKQSAIVLCDLIAKFAEAKYVQPSAPQPASDPAPSPTPSVSTPGLSHNHSAGSDYCPACTQATETDYAPRHEKRLKDCGGDGWCVELGLEQCLACAAPSVAGTQPHLRHRIADLLKIASSSEGGPSEDAVFDYVKALAGAAQGTPQVEEIIAHERQRAVEICDLTLERMIDRDACARAIRNPESKYPSRGKHGVGAPAQPGPEEKK